MPGIFEEREMGFESKWGHDEEMHFRMLARRNELLGRWAAVELGVPESAVDEYAQAVVQTGLTGKGSDPVLQKIRSDFDAGKVAHSNKLIHDKMQEFFNLASQEQIKNAQN